MTASWVNSLVDSGIKSDMLNFAADGVFTDAEAIQLLAGRGQSRECHRE
ncbi:hypothetical protein [Bradyrhizobium sp. JR3.5]